MSIFKTVLGITFFTTSIAGEATGKLGRYGSTATEYISCGGKHFTSFVSNVAYDASKEIDKLAQNDFTKITSSLTYGTGNLIYGASKALETTESISKSSKGLFEVLETKSKWLRGYATNLLRDEDYRNLKSDFDFKSSRGSSGMGDGEDWTLIKTSSQVENDVEEALNANITQDFKPLSEKPLPTEKVKESKLKSLGKLGNKLKTQIQQAVKPKECQEKKSNLFGSLFKFNRFGF